MLYTCTMYYMYVSTACQHLNLNSPGKSCLLQVSYVVHIYYKGVFISYTQASNRLHRNISIVNGVYTHSICSVHFCIMAVKFDQSD